MLPLCLLWTALLAQPEDWTSHGEHSGLKLETRGVPGSDYEEIRVTTRTAAPPAEVCKAVYGGATAALEKGFKVRQTLRETPDERWTYEQVSAPLVNDRDYTLHVRREPAGAAGCRVTFDTENDQGPPPRAGLVRIGVIRGAWDVAPHEGGGADVVYTVYAEPGGGMPGFLTRMPQRNKALEWMRLILGRVRGHKNP